LVRFWNKTDNIYCDFYVSHCKSGKLLIPSRANISEYHKYVNILHVKRTPLRSGRVTHLKKVFLKTCLFLLSTCVWHNSLSFGTLKCFLSTDNSFKTRIIYVDIEKTLVMLFPVQQIYSNFKPSCQIDGGHINVSQNKF